jgi:hypothetical protein
MLLCWVHVSDLITGYLSTVTDIFLSGLVRLLTDYVTSIFVPRHSYFRFHPVKKYESENERGVFPVVSIRFHS